MNIDELSVGDIVDYFPDPDHDGAPSENREGIVAGFRDGNVLIRRETRHNVVTKPYPPENVTRVKPERTEITEDEVLSRARSARLDKNSREYQKHWKHAPAWAW